MFFTSGRLHLIIMKFNLKVFVLPMFWCLTSSEFTMDVFDMSTDQVANYYKYPAEVHKVQTKDGYILTLHRLAQRSDKPPVLLMHGLMDSSATWLLAGPEKGLGFMLFDKGYDVWMGNFRGTYYSREHVLLSPTSRKFWDFSWDEMGKYDVPAMIDYILQVTERDKIFHLGHSMGTTTFYVMTSLMPEYNDKIAAHFSYSPIGFWGNTRSAFWRSTVPIENALQEIYMKTRNGAVLVDDEIAALKSFCFLNYGTARTCKMLLHLSVGFNANLDDPTVFSVYVNHLGSGSSIKTVVHYTQLVKSGRFREFDYYNSKKNKERYGTSKPRDYNVTQITAPVFFFYGANDIIASPIDVYRLYRMLPNRLGIQEIEDPQFNHLDFTMGPTAADMLYSKTIRMMEKMSRSSTKQTRSTNNTTVVVPIQSNRPLRDTEKPTSGSLSQSSRTSLKAPSKSIDRPLARLSSKSRSGAS